MATKSSRGVTSKKKPKLAAGWRNLYPKTFSAMVNGFLEALYIGTAWKKVFEKDERNKYKARRYLHVLQK